MILIGLTGLAGAGKSTAAAYLVRQHGFEVVPFAGPLKAMMRALGLDDRDLSAFKERPHPLLCGKSPRQAMQTLGTEWGRNLIGEDLWLNAWRARVESLARAEAGASAALNRPPSALRIVVDDVRFPNEVALVHSLGGWMIRITRSGAGSASGAGHASEIINDGLDVDAEIVNDGEPEAMFQALDDLI